MLRVSKPTAARVSAAVLVIFRSLGIGEGEARFAEEIARHCESIEPLRDSLVAGQGAGFSTTVVSRPCHKYIVLPLTLQMTNSSEWLGR